MVNKRKKKKIKTLFYNNKYIELKNKINIYSEKIPLYNSFINNYSKKTNSWYDMNIYESYIIDNNNYTFKDYEFNKPKKLLKCEKIILNPTHEQKKILLNMLEGYRLIYNYTLKFIKTRYYLKNKNNKNISIEEEKVQNEILNYKKEILKNKKKLNNSEKVCIDIVDSVIDNIFKTEIRQYKIKKLKEDDNYETILDNEILKTYFLKDEIHKVSKKFKTPVHTLNYAVELACNSYKSCLTNLKNGNIKKFNIRYIKSTKNSLIMDIEHSVIKDRSFIVKTLGKEIKNKQNKLYNCNHDCKLHYNRNTNVFTLLIPREVKKEETIQENKNNYISIDLGLRTFMNCKTNKDYLKIGNNIVHTIGVLLKKIDKCKNIKNRKNKIKYEKKLREKIKNKVDDFHWKNINYLTSNYKTIIIGKWSTKSIISKEDSVLTKMNKRIIQCMSYYKFTERLKYKTLVNENKLIIEEEWYTSKACTKCGFRKDDLGSNKIYKCSKCNINIDRDYNGSRNIFIKCIESIY